MIIKSDFPIDLDTSIILKLKDNNSDDSILKNSVRLTKK